MAKNIVVYSDGTGQDGGVRPAQRVSNVYKLYRASRVSFDTASIHASKSRSTIRTRHRQLSPRPCVLSQKLLASVTGSGITRNIADGYEFIINHYQPGDRIFLIGFSRGAYTVRCIANLLMLCGVPTRTPCGPLMRFRKAVRAEGHRGGGCQRRIGTRRRPPAWSSKSARRWRGYSSWNLAQPVGRRLDDVEHRLAKGANELLGVDRSHAPDHAGREIFFDAVGRSRRRCAQEPRLELLAVGAVVDPFARGRDPLAGRNDCNVANHGHDVTMPSRPGAQNAKTILGVVVGYSLDEARQHFLG